MCKFPPTVSAKCFLLFCLQRLLRRDLVLTEPLPMLLMCADNIKIEYFNLYITSSLFIYFDLAFHTNCISCSLMALLLCLVPER